MSRSVARRRSIATAFVFTHRTVFRSTVSLVASMVMMTGTVIAADPQPAEARKAPIIAQGRLHDATGRPAQGSVRLHIFDLDHFGGRLPVVASARTRVDGGYTLSSMNEPRLREVAARNNGYVNLMLVGITEAGSNVHFFDRKLSASDTWRARSETRDIDITASRPHGSAMERQRARGLYRSLSTTSTAEPQDDEGGLCYDVVDREHGFTMVGELHAGSDVTGTFTYGKKDTADSDISVKVSADGGNWQAGGSIHIGNEDQAEVTRKRSGPYGYGVKSEFLFKKFKKTGDWWIQGCWTLPNYIIAATRWTGSLLTGWDVRYLNGKCHTEYRAHRSVYEGGDTFMRRKNDFTWYSGAVKVFGAGFETKSGASTNVQLKLEFGSRNDFYWICGSNAKPFDALRVYHNG